MPLYTIRSEGARWAPTSSWRPIGPLDFVLRTLHSTRALRPVRRAFLLLQWKSIIKNVTYFSIGGGGGEKFVTNGRTNGQADSRS